MNGANKIACSVDKNGDITKAIPNITVSNPQKKPANKPYVIGHSPKQFYQDLYINNSFVS